MPNKRKLISLETKLNIINRVEKGENESAVSLQTELSYSTISTIVSLSKKIKTSVENNSNVTKVLTTKILSDCLSTLDMLSENDPDFARSCSVMS